MPDKNATNGEKKSVSVPELKQMLVSILDHNLPVYIRYRLIGEMWQRNFMKVLKLTDKGALLLEVGNPDKLIIVQNLGDIIQFEIDSQFQAFQPHDHYQLTIGEH